MGNIEQVYVLMATTPERAWCVGAYRSEVQVTRLRKRLQERSDRFYYQISDVEYKRLAKNKSEADRRLLHALEHADPEASFVEGGCSYVVYVTDLFN